MSAPPFLPVSSLPVVAIGRCAGGALGLAILSSATPTVGAVSQVTDINVTGATNSSAYSILAVGSEAFGSDVSALVSYTSDGSATQTEIRNGLLAAWNAHPIAGMLGSLATGVNKLTFTASRGGAGYTVTFTFPDNPSTDLTQTAVTAAADAATFYMGRAVEVDATNGQALTISAPSALNEPTITYTVTHGAGATYSGTFTVETVAGVEVAVSWTASAGAALANTLTNIETAIESAMSTAGFTGAIATVASPDVVVSFPLGYSGIVSVTSSATGGGGSPAMTVALDAGDAVPEYVLARDPQDTSPYRGQDLEALLPTNEGLPRPIPVVLGGGLRWGGKVVAQTSIVRGGQVYVETASGASNGKLTAIPSITAAPMRYQGRPVLFWSTLADTTLALVTI
jgi:hypothetical protein